MVVSSLTDGDHYLENNNLFSEQCKNHEKENPYINIINRLSF